jgi:hypothetical protein
MSPADIQAPTAVYASAFFAALLLGGVSLLLPGAAAGADVGGIEMCLGDDRRPVACVDLPAEPEPLRIASIAAQRVAGVEAGSVAQAVVPLEGIADDVMADAVWLAGANAADLYSTSYMLKRCATCFEANPLGHDAEARIALKAAAYPIEVGACYVLRRTGHRNWATGFRWAIVAVHAALAVNNACLGKQGSGCLW